MIQIDFQPAGRRIVVEQGGDLLTAAQHAGIDLIAACSGIGICGTCRIRLVEGQLSDPTTVEVDILDAEQINKGYRLACQAVPLGDVRIEVPPESLPVGNKLVVGGIDHGVQVNPLITHLDVSIEPPGLDDLRSDLTRLEEVVHKTKYWPLIVDLPVLVSLPENLRKNNWSVRLGLRRHYHEICLVAVLPKQTALYGLAVDIGSTKLAAYLVDMNTGVTVLQKGTMNPQISFGEDVVSRIAFANKSEHNRKILQKRLVGALNQMVEDLCSEADIQPSQIVEAALVGNTAMHHFLLGLPVEQLGASPYVPAVSRPVEIRAADLDLNIAAGAWIYLPANIAGYIGADHTAALLASQFHLPKEEIRILVDIGTNTEISLSIRNRVLLSCSTASGPAFEGAHIRDGMRAAPGAIEKVVIKNGLAQVKTVSGRPPVGICGTGILNSISELLKDEAITSQGGFNKNHPGVRQRDGRTEFLLVPAERTGHGRDIVITRKDINEIQLAKGAIRAGIEVLLTTAGIHKADVDEWVIAGAFGTFLDIDSALRVGMFPEVPKERFKQVGNAAGVGAKRLLISEEEREAVFSLAAKAQYVELTTYPEFTHRFVSAMNF